MSLFNDIIGKIFQRHPAATPTTATNPATPAAGGPTPGNFAPTPSGLPIANAPNVDVMKRIGDLARAKHEKLNWRESIVDLLKTLDLDSSLESRKALAKELHYDGDFSDSAKMNVWLQKQVMQKLAANGGEVPTELRHA